MKKYKINWRDQIFIKIIYFSKMNIIFNNILINLMKLQFNLLKAIILMKYPLEIKKRIILQNNRMNMSKQINYIIHNKNNLMILLIRKDIIRIIMMRSLSKHQSIIKIILMKWKVRHKKRVKIIIQLKFKKIPLMKCLLNHLKI